YILECADKTYYTGSTPRLEERLKEHNEGKGAKYTRGRRPLTLKQAWSVENRSQGLRLEAFLKKLSRQKKSQLIIEPQLLSLLAQENGYEFPVRVLKNAEPQ
ncbi:MAG: GIY-YIG nuclease family protein, partial [Desulfitobacterium sp.]|nr:GIY-YIG nuclease family protein [Desulfitobacterium sp.]